MFYAGHDTPPHLLPINARIELLIHQPTYSHVLASNQIKSVTDFGARFFVFGGPDHALNRMAENEIRKLVAGNERPN